MAEARRHFNRRKKIDERARRAVRCGRLTGRPVRKRRIDCDGCVLYIKSGAGGGHAGC
jgi:hypothetical protein